MTIGTNHQMLRVVQMLIGRATGKHYRIALDQLDDQSLRELYRLLRDLETEQLAAVNRAKRFFWQRI